MASISVCMIVKNEERVLERCLSSVADLMDEIIIVDNGSSDSEQMCIKDEIICNVKKIKSNIEIKYIYDKIN